MAEINLPSPVKILIIAGDEAFAKKTHGLLVQAYSLDCEVMHVHHADEALQFLAYEPLDVILVDIASQSSRGMEALSMILSGCPHLPVLVAVDPKQPGWGEAALARGAEDYLPRGAFGAAELKAAVAKAILRRGHHLSIIEAQRRQLREMSQLAITDSLTGLFNRRYLEHRLSQEVWRCARYGSTLSVVMLDLDHFKKVNDSFGHAAGDAVLSRTGHLIREQVRGADIPARYGGEELCVIMTETLLSGARVFAERLRQRVGSSAFTTAEGVPFAVTCSIGVAQLEDGDAHKVVRCADEALYRAKEGGRNRVCLHGAASSAA